MSANTAVVTGPMPVDRERLPVGRHRRMSCRFEKQFDTVRRLGGNDGDPSVLAEGLVDLRLETQSFGAEGQCGGLVVDEDAGDCDPHDVTPCGPERFWAAHWRPGFGSTPKRVA